MTYKQRGLSLVELIAAVTIISISLAVGLPLMDKAFGRKNIDSVGRVFEQSVNYARTEAATLSQIVRIEPLSGTGDWSRGWRLEYTNASGGDTLIREFDALSGSPIFTSSDFTGASPIEILPNGQAQRIGRLSLYYADCITGNGVVNYSLFLSGMLKKQIAECGGTP